MELSFSGIGIGSVGVCVCVCVCVFVLLTISETNHYQSKLINTVQIILYSVLKS